MDSKRSCTSRVISLAGQVREWDRQGDSELQRERRLAAESAVGKEMKWETLSWERRDILSNDGVRSDDECVDENYCS